MRLPGKNSWNAIDIYSLYGSQEENGELDTSESSIRRRAQYVGGLDTSEGSTHRRARYVGGLDTSEGSIRLMARYVGWLESEIDGVGDCMMAFLHSCLLALSHQGELTDRAYFRPFFILAIISKTISITNNILSNHQHDWVIPVRLL